MYRRLAIACSDRDLFLAPTNRAAVVRRIQCLRTSQLSRIVDHVDDWITTEQNVVFTGQMISYDLTNCLESLWADAIHLFLNLQSEADRPRPKSHWIKIQSSGVNDLLVLPRREGETFRDLEQDFQTHLVQFKIERQYLWSHRGVSKTYDFLEDIASASGNMSSHCLMHAFQRVAPFRSVAEANTTVQSYSRRMSIMVG